MNLRWEAPAPKAFTALVVEGEKIVALDADAIVATFDASGAAKQEAKKKKGASRKSAPPPKGVTVEGILVSLDDDGVLVFADANAKDGARLGTLHLASTEPASSWRLAKTRGSELVLALGEWLVWIDTRTRKTVRRVRASAKVHALAADTDLVVAGCEGGRVQAFRAESGEARGSFAAHEGDDVTAIAIGDGTIVTAGARTIRAWDRAALDVATTTKPGLTALHAQGAFVALGDAAGRVRVLLGKEDAGGLVVGESVALVRLARDETLLGASLRLAVCAPAPWSAPRPIVLREQATALDADDDYLFAGTAGGAVDVYELERSSHLTTHRLSDADVSALVRLPGALLVVGTGALDGRVFVVDVVEAKVLHRLSVHDDAFGVTCLACDPRGRLVASGSDEGAIVLLDPAKGRTLARLRVKETPSALAFDPSGRRIGCAFADGTAAVLTLGPKGATSVDLGLRDVARVGFSGDGTELLVAFRDGRLERRETRR